MSEPPTFYQTAKSLARNPLGIIALFIILVYAVAGIVISMAKPDFYNNPLHPAVLFLAIFPVVVLAVFAYLVVNHHRNLYAPEDYEDQKDFFRGLAVPAALTGAPGEVAIATSDTSLKIADVQAQTSLNESYTGLVSFGYALLHHAEVIQARTSPRSGRYRVRVWLESIEHRSLSDIESVTYHVWDDFNQSVISTADASSNFDLWLSIYGEFPVLALVKTKEGQTYELQRYIDLPGRPPD
ncbi:pYEATS domain-containing protein [Cellvibrio japonicus]|uniref:Prokaryotic YEATS domain-containing protein n=1 Tax=Cellvibrio japonicus (strain Ueda107) TaxID=498211 RepID=B3PF04_CELJU|nr:pYEATS domain-containing protein [Cellvibrio japonicus]ACE85032.1 hypothetical protein CJA_1730 [Cellvibrio japonicus Ueda107]QEI12248.1 hypothetical protein FY117_08425 [Cellvibrio japonicus]QEI15822.1 hypothetical protein FY116_08430 [Cellvibrio japonicus]QEI19400.1 hypothetical protein FY115_08425 [Cellvibrio japonicus]